MAKRYGAMRSPSVRNVGTFSTGPLRVKGVQCSGHSVVLALDLALTLRRLQRQWPGLQQQEVEESTKSPYLRPLFQAAQMARGRRHIT